MSDSALRARREAIVRRHMETEGTKDFEETIATFSHPRYEVVPTGEVHDGADALRGFYAETALAFPDFHFENAVFHHADTCVITEVDFVGTEQRESVSARDVVQTHAHARIALGEIRDVSGQ